MLKGICTIIGNLYHLIFMERKPLDRDSGILDDEALLAKAKQEWQAAHSFFNYVSDGNRIDQAIFNLIAAEKHYDYLLRKARREYRPNRKVK